MKESATYQAMVREGREEGRVEGRVMGCHDFLLKVGGVKFGAPDATTTAAIRAIDNLDRLENLAIQLVNANSWQELLPDTKPTPRKGKKR